METKDAGSTYVYEAIDKDGTRFSGEIRARSIAIAKADLLKQGIISKKIQKKKIPFFDKSNRKISNADIAIFTRQIATMLDAGIPLVQSFEIVAKGQNNRRMQDLLIDIKKDIETGTSLSDALSKYPTYFNDLFCNLIDAGEKSGSLDIMLEKLATYREKIESIKKKIKKALTYPLAVLVVAFLVTAGLMIFVVPQFESLFKSFGADLPALTRMVITISQFFQKFWYLIFGIMGGGIYFFIYSRTHSPKFAENIDRQLLRMPIIGNIMTKAAIARFSRTLSITFAAGLPLVEALRSVAGATGNILFSKATDNIREQISTGIPMYQAMEKTHLFPSMVTQMVAIGEESGQLEQMLSKVADYYEEEVDNAVDSLATLIEPLIMSILGILVGGLVVAMYLPIFKLGSVV